MTDGFGGVAFDDIQALKFFVLCMLVGHMAVLGGFSLGDVADELIGWMDHYADDTTKEGNEKTYPFTYDIDGTAADKDILYHYLTLLFGMMPSTFITLGGFVFGFSYTTYLNEIECDLDLLDATTKKEVVDIFSGIMSLEECYAEVPKGMIKLDLNNNGMLDRCEDATLLHALGNTKEYALTYSHHVPHSWAHRRCDQFFNPLYGS